MRDLAANDYKDPSAKSSFYLSKDGERLTADEIASLKNISLLPNLPTNDYWKEQEQSIKDYNDNLSNLDDDYKQLAPFNKILVRMFHIVAEKTESGIILEPKIPMKEITQNGIGVRQTMNSPWPYMKKGVVVATPENDPWLKPGDIVEVDKHAIMAIKPSVDHQPVLEHGFTNSEWIDVEPPTDLKNKHFGYILVDYRLILAKVKR